MQLRTKLYAITASILFAGGIGTVSIVAQSGCSDDDNTPTCIPKPEECNGLDDDCDGQTDEGGSTGLRRSCQTACGSGYEYCHDGVWEDCDAPKVETEICDGKDNDCNGQTDETCNCVAGATRPCGTNVGVCAQGIQTCVSGVWAGACEGGVQPAADDSNCNGEDDDCDGEIDEDCSCTPGANQPCGSDEGECAKGTQTCLTGGHWGDCTGQTEPATEICDGKDNDCDGDTDNNLAGDTYEQNEDCDHFRDLGTINEGDSEVSFPATLYPETDVDWYKIHTLEGTHLGCHLFDDQCYFYSIFTVELPDDLQPTDVLITIYADDDGQCGGDQQTFRSDEDTANEWTGNTWDVALQWTGTCGLDDS